MTTSAYELHVGVAAALQADSSLAALGCTYHAGKAPDRTPVPYIVGTSQVERERGWLDGRQGNIASRQLHIWAKTETEALLVYSHVSRVLSGSITIDDHTVLRGAVRLITTLHDPATGYAHAIAEYEAETKESA